MEHGLGLNDGLFNEGCLISVRDAYLSLETSGHLSCSPGTSHAMAWPIQVDHWGSINTYRCNVSNYKSLPRSHLESFVSGTKCFPPFSSLSFSVHCPVHLFNQIPPLDPGYTHCRASSLTPTGTRHRVPT